MKKFKKFIPSIIGIILSYIFANLISPTGIKLPIDLWYTFGSIVCGLVGFVTLIFTFGDME